MMQPPMEPFMRLHAGKPEKPCDKEGEAVEWTRGDSGWCVTTHILHVKHL